MRTLIENLIKKELSLMVEKRTVARKHRVRMRPQQRRNRYYNNAFSNSVADEKGLDNLIKFANYTSTHTDEKPYSWSLTRWVWISRRICEFAKTFKKPIPNAEQVKGALGSSYKIFLSSLFSEEREKKEMNDNNYKDIIKRFDYIKTYFVNAVKYGKMNKNGWDEIALYPLQVTQDVIN